MKATIQKESKQVLSNIAIPTGRKWRPTEDSQKSIIETGPSGNALKLISDAIHSSKEMICVCSFIMDSNLVVEALKVAADRGVKVYILGSASAKLKDEIEEEEHSHRKSYELLLTEVFQSRFLFRSAEFMHAKFILIDPRTKGTGFLTTCNFTQKAFKENPELVVQLNQNQIWQLYQIFVYHFWEHATHEQSQGQDFSAVRPLGAFPPPSIQDVLLTSPSKSISNLKHLLQKAIESARTHVYLSTFSIDDQFDLTTLIKEKLAQGVKVTIFTRCLPKQVELLFRLRTAGAMVMVHPLVHAKFLIADDSEGFVFTANFKSQGMESGMEVGLKLSSTQIGELMTIVGSWKSGFPTALESTLAIHKAPQKFELFKNGKFEWKELRALDPKSEKKYIRNLKDLRHALTELKNVSVPEFAARITHSFELNGPKIPESITEKVELDSFIYKLKWQDGKKTIDGLLLQPGFSQEKILSIPPENDHWSVFFEE